MPLQNYAIGLQNYVISLQNYAIGLQNYVTPLQDYAIGLQNVAQKCCIHFVRAQSSRTHVRFIYKHHDFLSFQMPICVLGSKITNALQFS